RGTYLVNPNALSARIHAHVCHVLSIKRDIGPKRNSVAGKADNVPVSVGVDSFTVCWWFDDLETNYNRKNQNDNQYCNPNSARTSRLNLGDLLFLGRIDCC